MRKSIVLALTALALTAGAGTAVAGSPEVGVSSRQVGDECWAQLRDAGYKGRPGDGREARYVPADQLLKLCGIATVQAEDGSWVPVTFYSHS